MDGHALQAARDALDEVKAIKAARRQSIEAEPADAELVAEPASHPEPEPSPHSPTPAEPGGTLVRQASTGAKPQTNDPCSNKTYGPQRRGRKRHFLTGVRRGPGEHLGV